MSYFLTNNIQISTDSILHSFTFKTKSKIDAFEIFYTVNDSIKHKLFIDNIEIKEYALDTYKEIPYDAIRMITKELIRKHNLDVKKIIQYSNDSLDVSLRNIKSTNSFNLRFTKNVYFGGEGRNNIYCKYPCDIDYDTDWQCLVSNNPVCVEKNPLGICKAEETDNEITNHNSIENKMNLQLLRDFRDQFLKKSFLGRKYIDYYYAISGHLVKETNLNLLIDIAKIIPEINSDIQIILNDGNNDTIIIDNNQRIDIINILNQYKAISTNQDFIDIIDDLINDINKFTLKSKIDIFNEFKD